MYLSRVELNEYRRDTMKALGSPQVMHASVMASFQAFDGDFEDRVLWRVDRVGNALYLLVQSKRRPDFTHIVEQYGRPATGQTWDTVEYDRHLDEMVEGSVWRFRLRANPTHSVMEKEGSRGKVYPHVTVEQQLKWLADRADRCGFSIQSDDGRLGAEVVQREMKRFQRDGKTVTLSVVTFEGVLKVTNPDLVRKAMTEGIGRAKAYGCGLLTTMRA